MKGILNRVVPNAEKEETNEKNENEERTHVDGLSPIVISVSLLAQVLFDLGTTPHIITSTISSHQFPRRSFGYACY